MVKLFYFLLLITLISCLSDEDLNLEPKDTTPILLDDGLEILSPDDEGLFQTQIDNVYNKVNEDKNLWSIRSLLIMKNDKLIAEHYFKNSEDINNRYLIWSCTKQVLAILTGIAIDKGFIKDINDPISNYLEISSNNSDKNDITIKQLLEMKSGISYNNDGFGGETNYLLREKADKLIPYILSRNLVDVDDNYFNYNDGDPHLIANIIQNAVGKPIAVWADEVLFSKLKIENFYWHSYKDGAALGGYGLEMKARDLIKIAQLVKNNGQYNGEQIVSSEWINQMLNVSTKKAHQTYSFGYQWWLESNRNIFIMWGHGGQLALISRDKDMIFVVTAFPNTQGEYQIDVDEIMPYFDMLTFFEE